MLPVAVRLVGSLVRCRLCRYSIDLHGVATVGELQSIAYDNCSLMMFVDEGCLFKKLLLHGEWFPELAPCLAVKCQDVVCIR